MPKKGIGRSSCPSGLVGLCLRVGIAWALASAATSDAATPTAVSLGLSTPLHFAVIGDYGRAGPPAQDVADLVKRWNPDFIITTGDNDYNDGKAITIDRNIGRYYRAFITPARGRLGGEPVANRFFPSLGNHDWYAPGAKAYLEYFTLPGNERYYEFTRGPVHFFALDSDPHESDGTTSDSPQGQWLQSQLRASRDCWKVVYFHHPPYSSGTTHGSSAKGCQLWPPSRLTMTPTGFFRSEVPDGWPLAYMDSTGEDEG